jgi:hypothetical protein
MSVFKATAVIDNDGVHEIHFIDVVEYAGQFWLVPAWVDDPALNTTRPVLIVSLATIPHERAGKTDPQFVVKDPIPKCILNGQIPPALAHKYLVLEQPDISLPLESKDVRRNAS